MVNYNIYFKNDFSRSICSQWQFVVVLLSCSSQQCLLNQQKQSKNFLQITTIKIYDRDLQHRRVKTLFTHHTPKVCSFFLSLFIYLFIYLSIQLFIYSFIYFLIYLFIYLFIYLIRYLFSITRSYKTNLHRASIKYDILK